MSTFKRFEDIEAWQVARSLTQRIYRITDEEPFRNDFCLRDQLRRASISIVSNIAEGFERDGNKEFFHFLSVAKGSCGEVRAQLYVALDAGYLNIEDHVRLQDEATTVARLTYGLMRYLRNSERRGPKYD